MSTVESLRDFFHLPEFRRTHMPLANIVIDTIASTISEQTINAGFDHFLRLYDKDGEPALELSLLTKDRIIHDFTFSGREHHVIYMPLHRATCVHLQIFYPESGDHLSQEPYRAELRITTGVAGVRYSVEGQRRLVESLVSYGQKCLRALHEPD